MSADYKIHIGFRWWVKPYMIAMILFMWSIAWAVDEDDPRVMRFIEKQSKFIAMRGTKLRFVEE